MFDAIRKLAPSDAVDAFDCGQPALNQLHAKDDAAQQWYQAFDFKPSPTDRYHLYLMLKDLKLVLGQ